MKHRAWWIAIGAFVVVSSAIEILSSEGSHSELLYRLPGLDFVFGVLGCALIVVAAKRLGKWFLQRPETYYEDRESRPR